MYQPSINTDYEAQWPRGIKREYWLNVSAQTISPDGFLKTEGKVFNNTYPGPLIEACWGDDIVSHKLNSSCPVIHIVASSVMYPKFAVWRTGLVAHSGFGRES